MNLGRWIADCPMDRCGNALGLQPNQAMFCCTPGGCNSIVEVEWPADVADLDAALSQRPVMETRNWAPAGHRQSQACGVPDGQTASDLIAEAYEHEGMS